MNVAIINAATGKIENVGVKEPGQELRAPDGYLLVEHEAVGMDWTWNGTTLVPPPAPAPRSAAAKRISEIEAATPFTAEQRAWLLENSGDSKLREKLLAVEAEIETERGKLL